MAALPAVRQVLVPFALTRLLTILVALLALSLYPTATVCADVCQRSASPLLDWSTRWDAGAFLDIARNGYSVAAFPNMAYFPLYPFLIRVVGTLLGGSDDAYIAAGITISNSALLVALVYLVRLVAVDRDARAGSRTALYLLVFPTSVFLAAVYSESLFIALAAASTYHARRGDWLLAGALAGLGALVRPFGAILALPLAIEAIQQRANLRALLAAVLPPAALATWLAILWRITGDPFALLTAQKSWGTGPSLPFKGFVDLLDPNVYGFPYFVAAFTLFIGALVVLSWRVLRPSLAAYATLVFLIGLSTGTLTSAPRYYLAVFPAFMVLGVAAPPWLGRAYVAAGAAIGVLLTAMFALWFWVS
jgi:hypothetical protein